MTKYLGSTVRLMDKVAMSSFSAFDSSSWVVAMGLRVGVVCGLIGGTDENASLFVITALSDLVRPFSSAPCVGTERCVTSSISILLLCVVGITLYIVLYSLK